MSSKIGEDLDFNTTEVRAAMALVVDEAIDTLHKREGMIVPRFIDGEPVLTYELSGTDTRLFTTPLKEEISWYFSEGIRAGKVGEAESLYKVLVECAESLKEKIDARKEKTA